MQDWGSLRLKKNYFYPELTLSYKLKLSLSPLSTKQTAKSTQICLRFSGNKIEILLDKGFQSRRDAPNFIRG